MTKMDKSLCQSTDYLPFGQRSSAGACAYTFHLFTGKETDYESGLDNFGARYHGSSLGRFMSPDPSSGTLFLNPQRWNMYSYALNRPLSYLDPDGRDAIAVKFGNLAHGFRHAGIISYHNHGGTGTFADFGPQHPGSPADAGKYTFIDIKTTMMYGPDGYPTQASLTALADELAEAEGEPSYSVRVTYIRTSDAETAALDAYIDAAKVQQAKGKTPSYRVGFRDCIWFCMNGWQKAGKNPGGSSILTIPNWWYLGFAAGREGSGSLPKENVTVRMVPCGGQNQTPCEK